MTKPVALVAITNNHRRASIVAELQRDGWSVSEQPTGAHLLAALAEVIEGTSDRLPDKIVVDARARGISGTSIATGLAALGLSIPVEVIDDSPPRRADDGWARASQLLDVRL